VLLPWQGVVGTGSSVCEMAGDLPPMLPPPAPATREQSRSTVQSKVLRTPRWRWCCRTSRVRGTARDAATRNCRLATLLSPNQGSSPGVQDAIQHTGSRYLSLLLVCRVGCWTF